MGFQLVAVACRIAGQDPFPVFPLGTPQQEQSKMQTRLRGMTVHAQCPSSKQNSEMEPRNTPTSPSRPRPDLGGSKPIFVYLRSEQGNDAKQLLFTANVAEQSLRNGVKKNSTLTQ